MGDTRDQSADERQTKRRRRLLHQIAGRAGSLNTTHLSHLFPHHYCAGVHNAFLLPDVER